MFKIATLILCIPAACFAEKSCEGFLYRPKRDNIAVLKEPDETADVYGYVSVGEHVCRIGERDSFALVKWGEDVGFVNSSLLWPPRGLGKEKGTADRYIEKVKNFFSNLVWR